MMFRLDIDVASMSQYWEAQNNQHVLTILGEPLSVEDDMIELPFQFSVRFTPGLDGEPKRQPLFDFVPSTNTMHKRLVDALQSAGVDNLQLFPAIVTDVMSGEISNDFVVVNVVGMVSAGDLDASTYSDLADVHVFQKLVLSPQETQRPLLFRLAESQIEIIVVESVADAIRGGKFKGVVLEPLEESTS